MSIQHENGKNLSLKTIGEGIIGAAAAAGTVVLAPVLRPWYSRWGATDEETRRPYPGDEWVPRPKSELTCAITIEAPRARVWPWFVQLGCQRGGWYSYDLLDNGGAPSASRIVPEYQLLEAGDVVKAVPNGSFGFPVAAIQAESCLTLAGTLNTATGQPGEPGDPGLEAYFSGDQTFYLEKVDENTTRLFFRMRTDWNATRMNNLIYRGVVEPISFVMCRKMLLNIKRLAESIR
jgi:proline iminopeptidase